VHLSWLVRADPMIQAIYGDSAWGLRHYRQGWDELCLAGDDIGVHPHAQVWSEKHGHWIGGQQRPGWAVHVLDVAFESYQRVFCKPPTTIRFGERFMSQEVAARAETLGFRFDLTLEPGRAARSGKIPREVMEGSCPSYFRVPRQPYRTKRGDYMMPARRRSGMWFLPVSTVPADEAPASRPPHHRPVEPARIPYVTLHLHLAPAFFRAAIDTLLDELSRPYLVLPMRSDMIVWRDLWTNLETLRAHPAARRFVFTTAEEAIRILV
jgi:hypothetical protein